jgi:hypothetical protein
MGCFQTLYQAEGRVWYKQRQNSAGAKPGTGEESQDKPSKIIYDHIAARRRDWS